MTAAPAPEQKEQAAEEKQAPPQRGRPDGEKAGRLGRFWKRWRAWILSVPIVAGVAWLAPRFSPWPAPVIWSNAPIIVPAGTIVALCLYIGYPHKHRNLPSMDSVVVATTSSFVLLDALRSILALWGMGVTEKNKILAPMIFGFAGLKALQRAFLMANEQDGEPQHKPDTTRDARGQGGTDSGPGSSKVREAVRPPELPPKT